jgi:hypothetical protein
MVELEEEAVVVALNLPLDTVVGHVLHFPTPYDCNAHTGPGHVNRRHPDRVIPDGDLTGGYSADPGLRRCRALSSPMPVAGVIGTTMPRFGIFISQSGPT